MLRPASFLRIAETQDVPQLVGQQAAYANREGRMAYLGVEPELDGLRSDPRFQDLLRRMHFPQ